MALSAEYFTAKSNTDTRPPCPHYLPYDYKQWHTFSWMQSIITVYKITDPCFLILMANFRETLPQQVALVR